MCGIVAVKGDSTLGNAIENLARLEYRGYDSCGIGYKEEGKIKCMKSVGYVEKLQSDIDGNKNINLAIGHTRWATHGMVSLTNSHPHLSGDGRFAIVHNGILENYRDLKNKYLRGVKFHSDTDSEVIAQLLQYNFKGNVWDAFKSTIQMLRGSFAIVMINEYDDSMYFARYSSPLVIGNNGDVFTLASDIRGLGCLGKISYLDDGSIGYIDNKVNVFDKNFKRIKLRFCSQSICNEMNGKGDYPHYMLKEIHDIPQSLIAINNWFACNSIKLPRVIEHIEMVCCGTSYHSSLVGKKYFEEVSGIPATCEIASEYIYNHHVRLPHTLGIFISQSGETADTISALKRAKSEGIFTLAITNVEGSTITSIADETIHLCAGSEICVASTKAYTSQVFALLKLSNIFKNLTCGNYEGVGDYCRVEGKGSVDYLNIDNDEYEKLFHLDLSKMMCDLDGVVDILTEKNEIILIGKDYDYITMKEAGLKIKEVTYTFTDVYPCGELKHGTLSLVDNDSIILALSTNKTLSSKVNNAIHEVVSRGGRVIGFGDFCLHSGCEYVIPIYPLHRYLMPIISIIPFDILAYKLSVRRGINPDKPRNLAKSVTVE